EVVRLAGVDQDEWAVRRRETHRLPPAGQVDDREPAVAERRVLAQPGALVIRPSARPRRRHRVPPGPLGAPCPPQRHPAAAPALGAPLPASLRVGPRERLRCLAARDVAEPRRRLHTPRGCALGAGPALAHQMRTRASGARYSASPSCTSNTSWNASRFET